MITWRQAAEHAIGEALKTMPVDTDEKQFRAHLSAAYPFGERAHHPYKVWLQCVNKEVRKRWPIKGLTPSEATKRAIEAHEQLRESQGFKRLR